MHVMNKPANTIGPRRLETDASKALPGEPAVSKPPIPAAMPAAIPATIPAIEVGLVLLDLSLQPIAFDGGALALLKGPGQKGAGWIPREIVKLVGEGGLKPGSSVKLRAPLGGVEYVWRVYLLEANVPGTQSIVAVHLEKSSAAGFSLKEVAARYSLTERELQVLSGISTSGLTNKELAQQMNISPLTVKAFLRMIMLKMGTTTRAGVVAKILHGGE